MMCRFVCAAILFGASATCRAQQDTEPEVNPDLAAIRDRISAYVEAFNSHDAAAVGNFWAENAVSVNQDTGDRKVGRDAIAEDFKAVFEANPNIRLSGQIDDLHLLRADVACAEGQCTLFLDETEPSTCVFSATLVKEGDQWLVSSSHEHSLPVPATPYEALSELDALTGTWQDQTEGASVVSTFDWTPSQAFLVRSYTAEFVDESPLQGTQIVGWDPRGQQIRTWTFNSDGSFGEGTVSKNGDDWVLKMTQVLSDGRLAAGTTILTPVDENTLTVHKIGETVDGAPIPTAEPVTVVRIDVDDSENSETEPPDASEDAEGAE